jgi:hypothetical protein
MPLISITRLRVRSLRYLPAFLLGSLRSAREAKNATGNLAVSLLSDAHLVFWTRTLWTDERSMRAFMVAPAHRAVMPKLVQWCDEAAVTHWNRRRGRRCIAACNRRGAPPGSIIPQTRKCVLKSRRRERGGNLRSSHRRARRVWVSEIYFSIY